MKSLGKEREKNLIKIDSVFKFDLCLMMYVINKNCVLIVCFE